MGLGCGSSLIKIVLFIFNLLCVIGGIAFVALGGLILAKAGDIENALKEHNTYSVPIGLIIVGSIIFVIAFFGCCGAVRESQCMTMTYAFFIFCLIVLQVVAACVIFVYQDDFRKGLEKGVRELFDNVQGNREAVDAMQKALQCCGSEGPDFWSILPSSCCETQIVGTCTKINAYQRGCVSKLREYAVDYSNYIAYVALGVAGVELLGLIFACCLATSIRNEKRRY
ncbi:23 kDa integral membrane protein-like isoform X2 [Culicoides brevitarsis]|uniref:23 kDa integral membrane protein-like isoform X2 n=1 Tax=Culicoides brevitarsis TaxID=469753 RepID=UPI00307B2DC2